MAEQFEVLPFGGGRMESELERQIMRGGMGRGGRRPLSRSAARPMGRHVGQPRLPPRGLIPQVRHGHHGRHRYPGGLRYPYRWPYWAPAYWGWSYPAGGTINVFDDGSTQDSPLDDANGAPMQDETQRFHRAGCRCADCSGPTFDVLPFTVNQLAALAGRNNWRARRR